MPPTTAFWPPAVRTSPVGRVVAVCRSRGVPIEPVAAHVPVPGSYSSAEATTLPARATGIGQVAGRFRGWEYGSEEATALPASSVPPVTSTSPVGSNVAVCKERAEAIRPVPDHTGVLVWAARGATVIDPRRPNNSRPKDVIRLIVRLPLISSPSEICSSSNGADAPLMVKRDGRPLNAMTTHPLLIFPLEWPVARESSAKPFTREDRKPPVFFPGVRYAFTAAPREVLRPVDALLHPVRSVDLVETGRCSNGDSP